MTKFGRHEYFGLVMAVKQILNGETTRGSLISTEIVFINVMK